MDLQGLWVGCEDRGVRESANRPMSGDALMAMECKHPKIKIGYNDGKHAQVLCAVCEADLGWIGGHPRAH